MQDAAIARWADLLVDYCLAVEPGEVIAIGSELAARPLVEACFKAVVLRGGSPLLRLDLPGLYEFFLQHASDAQLGFVPSSVLFEAEATSARIRISAETDTHSMNRIDPKRQAVFERAREPVRGAAASTAGS